jgi:hypothetical protein
VARLKLKAPTLRQGLAFYPDDHDRKAAMHPDNEDDAT